MRLLHASQGRRPHGPVAGVAARLILVLACSSVGAVIAAENTVPQSVEVRGERPATPTTAPGASGRIGAVGTAQPVQLVVIESLPGATALRLEDLTHTVPGLLVEPLNAGLSSAVKLRGFAVARLHRDGLPDVQRMFVRDLATVAQVEVVRGSAGGLAGIASPGGLINFISQRPLAQDHSRLTLATGSRSWGRVAVDFNRNLLPVDDAAADTTVPSAASGTSPAGLRLRLIASAHDGEADFADLPVRARQALLALQWRAGADQIDLDLGSHRNQTPFSFGTVITNAGPAGRAEQPARVAWDRLYVAEGGAPATRRAHELRLRWQRTLALDWQVNLAASRASVTRDERLVGFWTLRSADLLSSYWTQYHDSYRQQAFRLQVDGVLKTGALRHRLAIGADGFETDLRFEGTQNIGAGSIAVAQPLISDSISPPGPTTRRYTDEHSRERGLWLADRIALTDRLEWTGLLRQQRYVIASTRAPVPPPEVGRASARPWLTGLAWRTGDDSRLWWSASSGMEPNRGSTREGGFLAPQTSRQQELGWEGNWAAVAGDNGIGGMASLALWRIRLDGLAMADPAERGALMAAGGRLAQGLDAQFGLHAARWAWRAHLSLQATRQTVKTSATLGDDFVGVPRAMGGLSGWLDLPWQAGGAPVRLNAQWAGVGSRAGDAANTVQVPGHGRLDIGLRWRLAPGQARIDIVNVTDQRHVQGVTAADDVFQGPRRRLWLGWQSGW